MYYSDAGASTRQIQNAKKQAGHFGGVFSRGTRETSCFNYGSGPQDVVTAEEYGVAQMNRQVAANNRRPQTKSCHRNARSWWTLRSWYNSGRIHTGPS